MMLRSHRRLNQRLAFRADPLAADVACRWRAACARGYASLAKTLAYALAHLATVSSVRVVTFYPKAFSMRIMNTGPFSMGR